MTKRIFATAIAAAVIATSLPTAGAANALTVVPTSAKGQAVYVGSIRVYPTGYNINDNNYFKLRDVGKLAGFGVDWNEDTRTVEISTTRTAPELTRNCRRCRNRRDRQADRPAYHCGRQGSQHDSLQNQGQQLCQAARHWQDHQFRCFL